MAKTKNSQPTSPVYTPSRQIDPWTRTLLCTRAGGHCEFDGCTRYLLEHHVTFTVGNFSENAHIVAFSVNGPRGFEKRPGDIHDVSNLMLLCPTCHKLIDDNPDKFSRETLVEYKKNHEQQIFHLTGLRPEMKTSVLVVRSRVKEQTVAIPFDQVLDAVAPRYPMSKEVFDIDLTALSTAGTGFTLSACQAVEERVKEFLAVGGVKRSNHISVFALSTMPVLMFLGSQLSNKISTDVFQRHRDTESWKWKTVEEPVQYEFRVRRTGSERGKAALLLSLSGKIDDGQIPSEIDHRYSIYEITLSGQSVNPTFLRAKEDLERFKHVYYEALATIAHEHPGLSEIDTLPAVPAPIAVLCGRELLPRAHPALRVYDFDKSRGGFFYELTINNK